MPARRLDLHGGLFQRHEGLSDDPETDKRHWHHQDKDRQTDMFEHLADRAIRGLLRAEIDKRKTVEEDDGSFAFDVG